MKDDLTHIMLIAAREFRQIAGSKGFWISMLLMPLSLTVSMLVSRVSNVQTTQKIMLIDPAGKEAPALARQIDIVQQRQTLSALARYVERHKLAHVDPAAPWAHSDRWFGDAEVMAFIRSGGEKAALAKIAPALKPDTPRFDPPKPRFAIVETPADIASASPDKLAMLVRARLEPPKDSGLEKLNYALHIPAGFGAANLPVRLWTSESSPDRELVSTIQTVLTRDLRLRFLESAGTAPDVAMAAGTLAPILAIDAAPPGGGRERVAIRSVLPLVASFMLMMSLLVSGGWLLQGMIEERSNKLIESMLACVSPNALMYGKLIGAVATGLSMILFWIGCGVIAAYATQGSIADFLRPALASLSSPGLIAALIYFFVAGYLMVSMVYLAIGSVSDSLQDSQSFLTPVILVIVLPYSFLVSSVLNDSPSVAMTWLTWLPFWTPFTMLARLGSGVPLWELLGAGALLAAFITLEFIAIGRIFRASLLSSGQKPSLARLARLVRAREAG